MASSSREIGKGMKMTMQMIRARFSQVKQIQTKEVESLLSASSNRERTTVILLDVRSKPEFNVSHLQGAHSVNPNTKNMSEVLALINQQVPNAEDPKTVVAYCSVGYRSSNLIQNLMNELSKPEYSKERDLIKLFSLEGSIFKWANEGRPIVDCDNCIVKAVHPYNSAFGKLLNSELVSFGKDSQL